MQKIRYAVAGNGWRAMFYVRAAKNLPEWFELTGVLCHTREKAEAFEREHGVKAFWTLDALMETKPDFVVTCVSKKALAAMTMACLEHGVPVLSETPLAVDVQTLTALRETQERTGTPLEMAEQYFLYPSHQARRALVEAGDILGRVPVMGGAEDAVSAVAAELLEYPVAIGEQAEVQVQLPDFVYAPVLAGDPAGEVVLMIDGKEMARVPLVWRYTVLEAS